MRRKNEGIQEKGPGRKTDRTARSNVKSKSKSKSSQHKFRNKGFEIDGSSEDESESDLDPLSKLEQTDWRKDLLGE